MKNKAWRLVLAVMGVLMACGCSARGPLYDPSAPLSALGGEIVLYRPHGQCLRGTLVTLTMDGTRRVVLEDNGYVVIPAPPGEHTVVSGTMAELRVPPLHATVSLKAGERRYLRFGLACQGKLFLLESSRFGVLFHEAGAEQAQQELSGMRETTATPDTAPARPAVLPDADWPKPAPKEPGSLERRKS